MKYFYYKVWSQEGISVVQSQYTIHNLKQASKLLNTKVEKLVQITASQYNLLKM